ncbi:MAG: hypothetical protein MUF10_15395 [Thermoanaerobaculaceae bacterium]|nr:hypothetical protein [Thermoanaerobaculaceae bacterium]
MPTKSAIAQGFPNLHSVFVTVNGQQVEERIRSRWEVFEFEAKGLPRREYKLRLFRAGNLAVLNVLVDDLFQRAQRGDAAARVQYVSLVVAEYLPRPTRRRLSPLDLMHAHLIGRTRNAARRVQEAELLLDASVGGCQRKLPTDGDLEDDLMLAHVGLTCSAATVLLPQVREVRRRLLKDIWPRHVAAFAKLRNAGVAFDPNGPTADEKKVGHALRQEIRRMFPKTDELRRLTAWWLRREEEVLIEQANQLTLQAAVPQLSLTDAERRAFEYYRLRRPGRAQGPSFDGIIGNHRFISGLLEMCPSVRHRLIVTAFFQAWPKGLQPQAEAELERHLRGLLTTGRTLLDSVRFEDRAEKRARPVRPMPGKVGPTGQALATLDRYRRFHRLLTPRQRKVVRLVLKLQAQGQTDFLVAAAARIRRRRS